MNRVKIPLMLAAILLAGVVPVYPGAAPAETSADVVKVSSLLSVDKVKQGSRFQVAVILDINSGYHINSNHPTESFLIATSLTTMKSTDAISPMVVTYPRGVTKKFAFSDKPLSVYEGRTVIKFVASAPASAVLGPHTLHTKLTVQACNDQACLQPKTIDVDIPIEVVAASEKTKEINGEIFGTPKR